VYQNHKLALSIQWNEMRK